MSKRKDPGKTNVQFRADPHWLQQLDKMIGNISSPYRSNGGIDRSTFVRDLVGIEHALWRRSPYVCLKAQHYVLVTKTGEVLYHRNEILRLNDDISQIPARLMMKAEKRAYFSQRQSPDDVRRIWLMNNFSLWMGDRAEGDPLDSQSDRTGLSSKVVMLRCHLPDGATVLRESCIALEDYAQHLGSGGDEDTDFYDRVDILVDIPTRELELIVVVDADLHGNDQRLGLQERRLKLELRNREEVPFANTHALQAVLQDKFLRRIGNRYPPQEETDGFYDDSIEQIGIQFDLFQKRIGQIAQIPECLGHEGAAERLLSIDLPQRYLFYRTLWSWVHTGLYLSIKWVKPERIR